MGCDDKRPPLYCTFGTLQIHDDNDDITATAAPSAQCKLIVAVGNSWRDDVHRHRLKLRSHYTVACSWHWHYRDTIDTRSLLKVSFGLERVASHGSVCM